MSQLPDDMPTEWRRVLRELAKVRQMEETDEAIQVRRQVLKKQVQSVQERLAEQRTGEGRKGING